MRLLFSLTFLVLIGIAGCRSEPAPEPTTDHVSIAPEEQRAYTKLPNNAKATAVATASPTLQPEPAQEPEHKAIPTALRPKTTPLSTPVATPKTPSPQGATEVEDNEMPTAPPTIEAQPTPQPDISPAPARKLSPKVASADVEKLVDGNTDFALDLYRSLSESGKNLFFAPFSISLALAMTYAGARGDTEGQMADTLRFELPNERLHTAFNALDQELESLHQEEGGDGVDLSIANSVWGQEGHAFLATYLNTLALNYGAEVNEVDFRWQPQEARRQINEWISAETEGRIQRLIAPDAIDRWTRLVLANAVHFKAGWRLPFDKRATSKKSFYGLNGGESRVNMMRQTESLGYYRGAGYQAAELPYEDDKMSMVIFLPEAGGMRNFEGSLDSELLDKVLGSLDVKRVRLTMPKFEMDASLDLVHTLEALGMPNAFDAKKAEFQGIDGLSCLKGDDECLLISDVIHSAFLSVDETGTEAAAATAAVVGIAKSVTPDEPIELTVDRPFVFLIRDRGTGSVMFLGRVVEL